LLAAERQDVSRSDSVNVAWTTFTRPDGTSFRQIQISEESDWSLFERVAALLQTRLRGRWIERLDGLDQRYWDLKAGGGSLTLHLEHYLGITLYPTAGAEAEEKSLVLMERAHELLAGAKPG
jgi:hypothetical protein